MCSFFERAAKGRVAFPAGICYDTKKGGMAMDVRFLRYFLAVAQQESITKAAEIALSPEELATIDAILAAV